MKELSIAISVPISNIVHGFVIPILTPEANQIRTLELDQLLSRANLWQASQPTTTENRLQRIHLFRYRRANNTSCRVEVIKCIWQEKKSFP